MENYSPSHPTDDIDDEVLQNKISKEKVVESINENIESSIALTVINCEEQSSKILEVLINNVSEVGDLNSSALGSELKSIEKPLQNTNDKSDESLIEKRFKPNSVLNKSLSGSEDECRKSLPSTQSKSSFLKFKGVNNDIKNRNYRSYNKNKNSRSPSKSPIDNSQTNKKNIDSLPPENQILSHGSIINKSSDLASISTIDSTKNKLSPNSEKDGHKLNDSPKRIQPNSILNFRDNREQSFSGRQPSDIYGPNQGFLKGFIKTTPSSVIERPNKLIENLEVVKPRKTLSLPQKRPLFGFEISRETRNTAWSEDSDEFEDNANNKLLQPIQKGCGDLDGSNNKVRRLDRIEVMNENLNDIRSRNVDCDKINDFGRHPKIGHTIDKGNELYIARSMDQTRSQYGSNFYDEGDDADDHFLHYYHDNHNSRNGSLANNYQKNCHYSPGNKFLDQEMLNPHWIQHTGNKMGEQMKRNKPHEQNYTQTQRFGPNRGAKIMEHLQRNEDLPFFSNGEESRNIPYSIAANDEMVESRHRQTNQPYFANDVDSRYQPKDLRWGPEMSVILQSQTDRNMQNRSRFNDDFSSKQWFNPEEQMRINSEHEQNRPYLLSDKERENQSRNFSLELEYGNAQNNRTELLGQNSFFDDTEFESRNASWRNIDKQTAGGMYMQHELLDQDSYFYDTEFESGNAPRRNVDKQTLEGINMQKNVPSFLRDLDVRLNTRNNNWTMNSGPQVKGNIHMDRDHAYNDNTYSNAHDSINKESVMDTFHDTDAYPRKMDKVNVVAANKELEPQKSFQRTKKWSQNCDNEPGQMSFGRTDDSLIACNKSPRVIENDITKNNSGTWTSEKKSVNKDFSNFSCSNDFSTLGYGRSDLHLRSEGNIAGENTFLEPLIKDSLNQPLSTQSPHIGKVLYAPFPIKPPSLTLNTSVNRPGTMSSQVSQQLQSLSMHLAKQTPFIPPPPPNTDVRDTRSENECSFEPPIAGTLITQQQSVANISQLDSFNKSTISNPPLSNANQSVISKSQFGPTTESSIEQLTNISQPNNMARPSLSSILENANFIETLLTKAGLSSDSLRSAQDQKQDGLKSVNDTFHNILKSAATSVISRLVEKQKVPEQVSSDLSDSMSMSPPTPPSVSPPSPPPSPPSTRISNIPVPPRQSFMFVPPPLPSYEEPSKKSIVQQPPIPSNNNKTSSQTTGNSEKLSEIDYKKRNRSDFDSKLDWQERVAMEVKLFLKPAFVSHSINKTDYKDIMKRCVTKITRSGVTEINTEKIAKFVTSYVERGNKTRTASEHNAVSSSQHR